MNQIGFLEQQQELRGLSQQIHFLNGKARGATKRKKRFQLLRRVRRLRILRSLNVTSLPAQSVRLLVRHSRRVDAGSFNSTANDLKAGFLVTF